MDSDFLDIIKRRRFPNPKYNRIPLDTDIFPEKVKNYRDIKFSYFPSRVEEVKPMGEVSLRDFLKSHIRPKKSILDTFKALEEATKAKDEIERSRIKQSSLYYFTPSVRLKYRNYSNIIEHTNIMVAECDNIGIKLANTYKNAVFNHYRSCICAYLSPSKNGVKFLFYIPNISSIEEYKSYFYGLACDLQYLEGFDESNQICILPLFLSYDRDMLIRAREDIIPFVYKGEKLHSMEEKDFSNFETVTEPTSEDLRRIDDTINSIFRRIEEDRVGHPNVFNLACLLGGYTAAGYGDQWDKLEKKIRESNYLSKNTNGYLATALNSFKYGLERPLLILKK